MSLCKLLKNILGKIITNLLPNVKGVYCIGSFAYNDISYHVISSKVYLESDIDLVIDISIPLAIIYSLKRYPERVVKAIENLLCKHDIICNLSITIIPLSILKILVRLNISAYVNSLYLYELSPITGRFLSKKIPWRSDVIRLIISAIADYLFFKLRVSNKTCRDEYYKFVYLLSKRYLTLLYSLLLLNKVPVKDYSSRCYLTLLLSKKLSYILSEDLLCAQVSLRLRRKSALKQMNDVHDIINYLDRKFKEMTLKILIYELCAQSRYKSFRRNNFIEYQSSTMEELFRKYTKDIIRNYKAITSKNFLICLCLELMLCILRKSDPMIHLALIALHKGYSIEDYLRYLCLVIFLLYGAKRVTLYENEWKQRIKYLYKFLTNKYS